MTLLWTRCSLCPWPTTFTLGSTPWLFSPCCGTSVKHSGFKQFWIVTASFMPVSFYLMKTSKNKWSTFYNFCQAHVETLLTLSNFTCTAILQRMWRNYWRITFWMSLTFTETTVWRSVPTDYIVIIITDFNYIVIITRFSIAPTTISVECLLLKVYMCLADDSYYLIALCTEAILLRFEKLQILYMYFNLECDWHCFPFRPYFTPYLASFYWMIGLFFFNLHCDCCTAFFSDLVSHLTSPQSVEWRWVDCPSLLFCLPKGLLHPTSEPWPQPS